MVRINSGGLGGSAEKKLIIELGGEKVVAHSHLTSPAPNLKLVWSSFIHKAGESYYYY